LKTFSRNTSLSSGPGQVAYHNVKSNTDTVAFGRWVFSACMEALNASLVRWTSLSHTSCFHLLSGRAGKLYSVKHELAEPEFDLSS